MHAIVLSNRKGLYLPHALASLDNVVGLTSVTIVDDSGDAEWRDQLRRQGHIVISVATEPAGYTRAMQTVWRVARELGGHIFFLEEDFTIDREIVLTELAAILADNPNLAQVALQRQAWYPVEHTHGLIGAQRNRGHVFTDHGTYLEHQSCFTGNPSLIAASTFDHNWPGGTWTEEAMTQRLVNAGRTFAYYGSEGDEYVTHLGEKRAEHSHGY